MASGQKDRTTDDMVNWAKQVDDARRDGCRKSPTSRSTCTRAAAPEMGRDYRWFMEEASRVIPEIADKDQTYRDWIIAALKDGRLK